MTDCCCRSVSFGCPSYKTGRSRLSARCASLRYGRSFAIADAIFINRSGFFGCIENARVGPNEHGKAISGRDLTCQDDQKDPNEEAIHFALICFFFQIGGSGDGWVCLANAERLAHRRATVGRQLKAPLNRRGHRTMAAPRPHASNPFSSSCAGLTTCRPRGRRCLAKPSGNPPKIANPLRVQF